MKSTVMQYVSLTVMMLLIVVLVSLLPERTQKLDNSTFEKATTAANSLSVVKSAEN